MIFGLVSADGAIRESASTVVEDGNSKFLPLLNVRLFVTLVLLITSSITGPYCVNSSPYNIQGTPESDNCSFERFITVYGSPSSLIFTKTNVGQEL